MYVGFCYLLLVHVVVLVVSFFLLSQKICKGEKICVHLFLNPGHINLCWYVCLCLMSEIIQKFCLKTENDIDNNLIWVFYCCKTRRNLFLNNLNSDLELRQKNSLENRFDVCYQLKTDCWVQGRGIAVSGFKK